MSADFWTQFYAGFENLTPEEKRWFRKILESEGEEMLEILKEWDINVDEWPGFDHNFEGNTLYVYADMYGYVDSIATLAQKFLQKFRPDDSWSFEWANSADRLVPDGYSGGAAFVTAKKIAWLNSSIWIEQEHAKWRKTYSNRSTRGRVRQ